LVDWLGRPESAALEHKPSSAGAAEPRSSVVALAQRRWDDSDSGDDDGARATLVSQVPSARASVAAAPVAVPGARGSARAAAPPPGFDDDEFDF
jgi:hypothetical protein